MKTVKTASALSNVLKFEYMYLILINNLIRWPDIGDYRMKEWVFLTSVMNSQMMLRAESEVPNLYIYQHYFVLFQLFQCI